MTTMQLEDQLDTLLTAHRVHIYRNIDANTCGTDYDHRRADKAEEEYRLARETFLREVAKALRSSK